MRPESGLNLQVYARFRPDAKGRLVNHPRRRRRGRSARDGAARPAQPSRHNGCVSSPSTPLARFPWRGSPWRTGGTTLVATSTSTSEHDPGPDGESTPPFPIRHQRSAIWSKMKSSEGSQKVRNSQKQSKNPMDREILGFGTSGYGFGEPRPWISEPRSWIPGWPRSRQSRTKAVKKSKTVKNIQKTLQDSISPNAVRHIRTVARGEGTR